MKTITFRRSLAIGLLILFAGAFGVPSTSGKTISSPQIDVPFGSTPTLDGIISAGEYTDANYLTLGTSGGTCTVYFKHHGTTLYVAFDVPNLDANSAVQIFVDTDHDQATLPQPDDYRFTIARRSPPNEYGENQGTGSGWTPWGPPVGWTGAHQNLAGSWNAEFAIPYAKLGLVAGVPKTMGISFENAWTSSGDHPWPAGQSWINPSTWGDVFSSDNWAPASEWQPYGERYAIIIMGGNEPSSGQLYRWYWGDTGGMFHELLSYGFTGDNIYFLSYGDSANAHPDWVDAVSTTNNIRSAYQWAQTRCSANDLLYIYWVDHGTPTYFNTNGGIMTYTELGTLMQPIVAKQIIGAYNPCYSGCVIDDISRFGVITVTSQDCFHPNSWGWAGMWRRALRGAPEDSIDTNGDGYISMAEAYNWIAPRSQSAGEHSMFDDNGDGVGHEWGQAGYDPDDPSMDGYNGKFYSLDGWAEVKEEGLVGYWNCDEGSGTTVHDGTPNHHDGTIYGATWTTNGASGNALQFDGNNDYVSVPDDNAWAFGSNDFTIALWDNFDEPGHGTVGSPGDIFIGNDEGGGQRNKWFFSLGGGFLCFHINGPSFPQGGLFFPQVPFSPVVGQWYQLAITRSGSTYTIFVNGGVGGSAVETHAVPNANAPLTIGEAEGAGFVHGRLDEVRIYNRALSEAEIESLYCGRSYIPRDANGDGVIDISDVVFLLNYLFQNGPAPNPLPAGDANCDCVVDIGDVVYLLNYLFNGGPSPCSNNLPMSSPGLQQSLNKDAKTATIGFCRMERTKDDVFEIPLEGNFDMDVAGVQLDISYDAKEVTLLEPALTSRTEGLQVFSYAQDGIQRIGLVDLNGQNYVLAGDSPLVRIRGKGTDLSSIKIKEAILVDKEANKIPVEIVGEMNKDEEGSEVKESFVPKDFSLSQNLPNPFNPQTEISYDLPNACHVKLSIYNLLGQRIRTLVDEFQTTGHKTVRWDGKDDQGGQLASGIYFYQIQAGDFTDAKKMMLMK